MSDEAAHRPVIDADPAHPVDEQPAAHAQVRRSAYHRRFAAVYLALAVIAGGAIGAFVVLLARPDPAPTPRWSTFVPEGSSSARLHQIINTIPQKYRRKDGSQLVSVSVSGPQAQVVGSDGQSLITVPVQRIAVEEKGDFHVVEAGDALQYTLCGNGRDCVIDTGTPSSERFTLVQRQALELALYTFKYVDGVSAVTLLLPPSLDLSSVEAGTPELRRTALFLRRTDVAKELEQPLVETLTPKTPRIGQTKERDLSAIVRLSQPHIYSYSLTQTQDGAFMYVLKPQVG